MLRLKIPKMRYRGDSDDAKLFVSAATGKVFLFLDSEQPTLKEQFELVYFLNYYID
jgi:hypothetical protein